MQYIFIIAVIFLVIAVLFFITNKRTISFDKDWVNLVKNKKVYADKNFVFQKDGELIIDGKKKLNFIKAISNNSAVYSHGDYINKFMLVFSGYPSIKVTFMEGYISENGKLYYTYAYKKSYYDKLHLWMQKNGVFESKEVWVAKKNINWKTFPAPMSNDINWEKRAPIGDLI
ncbi:hypothetical protein [Brachyspira catarrhinii]|uniref:Uncharacterized protein n=1 Tax=Brachyspira catarrhinii TaxID=2528966 RepID=A0ABY2TNH1_9SPIR|nr:hypothetical protein [Brachyspira catarrhinii]TKZ30410.1 hypothetical protein EZH24_10480 [Brachyspira catarrhinii]